MEVLHEDGLVLDGRRVYFEYRFTFFTFFTFFTEAKSSKVQSSVLSTTFPDARKCCSMYVQILALRHVTLCFMQDNVCMFHSNHECP